MFTNRHGSGQVLGPNSSDKPDCDRPVWTSRSILDRVAAGTCPMSAIAFPYHWCNPSPGDTDKFHHIARLSVMQETADRICRSSIWPTPRHIHCLYILLIIRYQWPELVNDRHFESKGQSLRCFFNTKTLIRTSAQLTWTDDCSLSKLLLTLQNHSRSSTLYQSKVQIRFCISD